MDLAATRKLLADAATKHAEHTAAAHHWEDQRAAAIRALLEHGMTPLEVAELSGLSRCRIYQIRDGRR